MTRILSIHSFRGGTGKSNTTANVAVLLAQSGRRVGIVDTDIQSPGIHVLCGLEPESIRFSLNDYLWGKCPIEETAYDIAPRVGLSAGSLHLIPSSVKAGDIARVLHDGYDVNLLNEGFQKLATALKLDDLLIDTHPGLNEETLLSIALSQMLLVIMRPDSQDYQGTAVTVSVARQLEVPKMAILVNKAPESLDPESIRRKVQATYSCPVLAVVPHSEDMMLLASQTFFVLKFPDHPLTRIYRQVVQAL